ncbi:hypothetical protein DN402_00755 [Streptomyces sp. SW4]|nr:hypothetical protein DN402_00755 [Streptomyces sp. SW4]
MTTSATEFETDLVDLSRCGLQDVMTSHDPRFVDALHTLVRRLGETPALQSASGERAVRTWPPTAATTTCPPDAG